LIATSSQQVGTGVALVGETGEALLRITAGVLQINRTVAEIAASAQEQATGLQQVNTAVNQMDQATQQNAAMVEESTAASHSLSSEASELQRLVGRFRIDGVPVKAARAA
jgi:methyl-accepting chemotaxis protein